MPSNLNPGTFYRREAERLRSMAESDIFADVRNGLITVARQYEVMADQAEGLHRHTFGTPLARKLANGCGA